MRVDRGRLGWGVFLVVLGLVPLTVTTGLVDVATVRQAWQLWPLILVGLGIGLLVGRRGALVSTLVVAVTLGLAAGGALAGSGGGSLTAGCTQTTAATGPTSGTLSSGSTVTIEAGCDHLDVTSQPGGSWQATGLGGSAVGVQAGGQGLVIRPANGPFRGKQTMSVVLPTDAQLDLHVKGSLGDLTVVLPGAHLAGFHADVSLGQGRFDLGGATLSGTLEATFSLGSGSVTLPTGTYAATLSSSFGSMDVCVPSGEPAHVTARSSFGSANVDGGFDHVTDGWQTPDYATATQRVDLRVSSSFGSINITRGDCG